MSYLILGAIAFVVAYVITVRVAAALVVALVMTLLGYLGMPPLNPSFGRAVAWLGFTIVISGGVSFIFTKDGKIGRFAAVLFFFLIALSGVTIANSSIFRAAGYYAQLGPVDTSVYAEDTEPLDIANVRVVDGAYARRLAEKRLGESPALGSVTRVGELTMQRVGSQYLWVGPLAHSGFFKWLRMRSTPGYVTVSATDERDVRLVQQVGGDSLALRYVTGAYFGSDVRRHLYENGFSTAGLSDFSFEIDDAGRPFYVVTTYRNKFGFRGAEATGVAVIDPESGKIERFATDEVPAWIERVQPAGIIHEQVANWGRFGNGWWNALTACRGCLKPTKDMSIVDGKDGRSWFYMGVQSKGADESTIGFLLIDTRTKEARLYRQPGATATAAMRSVEGSVQEKGYVAGNSIPYNVSGVPTYFMTLKDKEGLVKMAAFASIENYQIVGIGEDVAAALRAYRRTLASRGNETVVEGGSAREQVSGRIIRLTQDSRRGETYYYLLLAGHEQQAFVGSSSASVEMPLTREGDSVRVAFEQGGGAVADIMEFDNFNLALQTTVAQAERTAAGDSVRAEQARQADVEAGTAVWEKLSPEERARVIEAVRDSAVVSAARVRS